MEIGIIAGTFDRQTLDLTLKAVASSGHRSVQFNIELAGIEAMPRKVPESIFEKIRLACQQQKIEIAALSGTYNMIHPDPEIRADGMIGLETIIEAAARLGIPIVTLCTGTRDPNDMWQAHPDNDSEDAWQDLIESMTQAVSFANAHQVMLGVEPEPGNVITGPVSARRLLDQLATDRVGIIVDPANLGDPSLAGSMKNELSELFALVGDSIILAHAKDRTIDGRVVELGTGAVSWSLYGELLANSRYSGPLIMHGMAEDEVDRSRDFLYSVPSINRWIET